mgnify:FL=1|jgi:hypothetical protein
MINCITNKLVEGDALEPNDLDLIVQQGRLNVGLPVPQGWRVLTGNQFESHVARVAYRFEIRSPT